MKSNPPIKGHELLHEGQLWSDGEGGARGGCKCGAMPPGARSYRVAFYSSHFLQTPSVAAIKRWHREHKEAVRRGDP